MAYHFLVLGSEKRQLFLKEMLEQKGYKAVQAEKYQKGTYDAVLLPVPQTAQYLEACLEELRDGQIVFGCNYPDELVKKCAKKKIPLIDYMKAEGTAYLNSISTAEGAIAEALQWGQRSIYGSRCVVLGYGRCGEALAERLERLHGIVTVVERDGQKRAKAQVYGCESRDFSEAEPVIAQADFIFNTVPAMVLTKQQLSLVSKDVTIIDIASRPGGVDFEFCEKNKICAKLCLGLPGKYAPKSAAEILLKVIEKKMPKGA